MEPCLQGSAGPQHRRAKGPKVRTQFARNAWCVAVAVGVDVGVVGCARVCVRLCLSCHIRLNHPHASQHRQNATSNALLLPKVLTALPLPTVVSSRLSPHCATYTSLLFDGPVCLYMYPAALKALPLPTVASS